MANVKFKTGKLNWLPSTPGDGIFYMLTDEKDLYLDSKGNRYIFLTKNKIESLIKQYLNEKQDKLTSETELEVKSLVSSQNIKSGGFIDAAGISSSGNVSAKLLEGGLEYSTSIPTADNNDGVKIVLLSEEPETKYNGWLYLIEE